MDRKVIVVTGASGALGRVVVEAALARGMREAGNCGVTWRSEALSAAALRSFAKQWGKEGRGSGHWTACAQRRMPVAIARTQCTQ